MSLDRLWVVLLSAGSVFRILPLGRQGAGSSVLIVGPVRACNVQNRGIRADLVIHVIQSHPIF